MDYRTAMLGVAFVTAIASAVVAGVSVDRARNAEAQLAASACTNAADLMGGVADRVGGLVANVKSRF